jgi:crotonobetaine/carnitine-CoA ligase
MRRSESGKSVAVRRRSRTSESVFAHIVRRCAAEPHTPLIIEAGGAVYTYADSVRLVSRWSRWLRREAAIREIRIAALLPNIALTHLLRVAAAEAGVVFTALNPLMRGKSLMDALGRSHITDLVLFRAGNGPAMDLNDLLLAEVDAFVVHWCDGQTIDFATDRARAAVASPQGFPPPAPCQTLVYTSGTSGPAKPVRIPAELMFVYGRMLFGNVERRWSDGGFYSPWHPAHVLGAVALEAAVERGLWLVVREKFDVASFWKDVVEHSCRLTVLISVADSVWAHRADAPRSNPLEIVGVASNLPDRAAFEQRFGVDVVTIYGMTELGTVMTSGRPARHYRCKIVPPDDGRWVTREERWADGSRLGELVVKPRGVCSSYEPGSQGAEAWQDGWFHTGDLFIRRADGFHFVGRMKDVIRRKGRNISAQDLEDEVRTLPGVQDCACVGYVSGDHRDGASDDDEVRMFILPEEPTGLDVASIVAVLTRRLPSYMVPRYVDVVSRLPLTANGKVSRRTLRETPLTDQTFDRKHDGDAARQAASEYSSA